MATRASIMVQMSDGTFKCVYSHWDGYVEGGVGQTLYKYYNSQEKAEYVVSLGDISSLGETMEQGEGEELQRTFETKYGGSVIYSRDRGDEDCEGSTGATEEECMSNHSYGPQELNYVWRDNQWFVTGHEYKNAKLNYIFLNRSK